MGDPHHNTWGGKNNSWGNRTRKKKENNQTQVRYEPSKLFNILAGGAFLFICGAFGLSILGSMFTGIKDALDTVDTVKDIASSISETSSTSSTSGTRGTGGTGGTGLNLNIDIDITDIIDEEDVAEILEYISNKIGEEANNKTLVIDYDDAKDVKSYNKNVISKLNKYKHVVLVYTGAMLSDNEMQTEMQAFQQMAVDNVNMLKDTPYRGITVGGQTNNPNPGNFVISITYLTGDEAN